MSESIGQHRGPAPQPSGDFSVTQIEGKYGSADIFEGYGSYSASTHRLTVKITKKIIKDFNSVRGKIHVTGRANENYCPEGKFFNDYAHWKVSTDQKTIELWN
jgi:hypothetical protein